MGTRARRGYDAAVLDLRYVQIQTLSRCNADCVFCPYVESWHAAHPGRMDDALWAEVLRQLEPFAEGLSKGMVAPYLMNEPLLDPALFQRISDIYARFPDTMVVVATNAVALTERNTTRLLEVLRGRKHQIWVSYHGIGPDTLRTVMRVDPDRALFNTLALLKRGAGFRIQIRGAGESLDGRRTWFTTEDYRAYWAALFREHDIDPRRVHIDAFRFHDRAGALRRTDRGAGDLSVGKVRDIDPAHPFRCPRVDQWLHVLWDGTLRLCCMDWHGEVEMPNLREVTLKEWFASDAYRALVATVTGRTMAPEDWICTRCTSPGG